MFVDMLAESVARAVYWLLIIAGVCIGLRYLIKDFINFMLESDGKEEPPEE